MGLTVKRRRGQDAPPPPPTEIVAAETTFDFLEGAFERAERSRVVVVIVAGALVVALAGLGLFGLSQQTVASSLQSQVTEAQTQLAATTAELAVLDSAEGLPSETISSHLSTVRAALAAAVGREWDLPGVTTQVVGSAPGGVQVTRVVFADGPEGPVVTVSATATGFTELPQWSQMLNQVPALSAVNMTWSGGGDSVSVEVTAALTAQALSARAQELGAPPPSDQADPGVGDPDAPGADEPGGLSPQDAATDAEDLIDMVEGGQP